MALEYNKKAPDWQCEGVEPEEQLKAQGFAGGYKPPAAYFNWFWHLCSNAIKELQDKTKAYSSDNDAVIEELRKDINEIDRFIQEGGAGGEGVVKADATSTDGASYTATADGIKSLEKGTIITIIPNMTSTTTLPKLNLNGLGAKNIKQRLSENTSLTVQAANSDWLVASKPVTLQYDGTQWVTLFSRSSGSDMYGTIGIESGGTGATTASQALTNLGAAPANHTHGEYQASITGAATTIASSNLTASRALVSNSSGKVTASSVTSTQLGYLSGVTSAVQTQLNGKAEVKHTHSASEITGLPSSVDAYSKTEVDTMLSSKAASNHTHSEYQGSITGAATTIASSNLTVNRALVSNGSGKVAVSAVTSTELGYLDGVTSAIQTQLDNKAASSHNQAASTITTGTFPTTAIYAKTGTDYTTARIRNIKASTTDLTAGTSTLNSGDIYLVYE